MSSVLCHTHVLTAWRTIPWQREAFVKVSINHVDGLVQERRYSIALAMELRLFCTKPSACFWFCNGKFIFSNPIQKFIWIQSSNNLLDHFAQLIAVKQKYRMLSFDGELGFIAVIACAFGAFALRAWSNQLQHVRTVQNNGMISFGYIIYKLFTF